jgi:hypothetical protein
MAIKIKPSHRGLFAKSVGKQPGIPISEADVEKGKESNDPAERKRAVFADNAKHHFKKQAGKARAAGRANRMYGAKAP